jgi:cell cycle checkpoint control protein RAD9A
MDCIIPSHSVRPFCAAIGCLSRMGKDLYVEFDPLEGLTLRALNDAKSAFCSFHFEPSFFERCSAPPTRKRALQQEEPDGTDNRYSCRVSLRAMAAIVRPRRHVLSLRLRNESSQQHYLSFEFQLQKSGLLTVVHRMGVAEDAQRVAATASREGGSEIVTSPAILIKMLEPLHKRSPEVALIVNDSYKVRFE